MKMNLSQRSKRVRQSDIRSMTIACREAGGINLAQGLCDMEVPFPVIRGAREAMEAGINIYTPTEGLDEIRRAISEKQMVFSGVRPDPEREIVVSAGATAVFYCACLAILDPGDEVLLFEPYYGYHRSTLESAGAKPVFVATKPSSWALVPHAIKEAITEKTRALMVCTPGNPSGHILDENEIRLIAEIAEEHNLWVFTDEIYEHFVYENHKHQSPAFYPGMKKRSILISGLSKTYSITGWRIGYCLCSEEAALAIAHINDLIYVCAPSPLQMGAARGLSELGRKYYENLGLEHERKRDMFCESLERAGLPCNKPQGAYYVLADVSAVPGDDSRQKAMNLLKKTGVAGVPGRAFFSGDDGDNLIRFCFAKEWPLLKEACQRLENLTF